MLARRNTIFRTPTVPRDKHSGVRTDHKALADYVRRVALEKGLSGRAVAERGQISHVTVSDIINGNRKDIKTDTLLALARGLGVTEQEIFAASLGKDPNDAEPGPLFKDLVKDLASLPEEDQQELRPVIAMLREDIRRRQAKGRKAD